MEYEIEDEGRLFDRSNNPSLEHHHPKSARRKPARTAGQNDSLEARTAQKAILIPEEEEQPA